MKIQSFSDVITNSSSELYVFAEGKTVEEVIEQLNEVVPGWQYEYYRPEYVKDTSRIQSYAHQVMPTWFMKEREEHYYCRTHNISPKYESEYLTLYPRLNYNKLFNKDESYAAAQARELGLTPEEAYTDWDEYDPFGDMPYLSLSDRAYELIRKRDANTVLMWSEDENPDWDRQEQLMTIGKRYHLG